MVHIQCARQPARSSDDPPGLYLVVRRPCLGTVRAVDHDSTTTNHASRRDRPPCWTFGISARQHSMGEFRLVPRARGMLARCRLCHAGAGHDELTTPPLTNMRRSRPTEREVLMASVGGYKPMLWEPPHDHQLPCLDPSEHEENAQCIVCMENVENRGDADVLLMECGHCVGVRRR